MTEKGITAKDGLGARDISKVIYSHGLFAYRHRHSIVKFELFSHEQPDPEDNDNLDNLHLDS